MRYFKNIIVILMLIHVKLNGQNGEVRAFYEVNINNRESYERAEVYSGNQEIRAKDDRVYYWYSSNKIINTTGGYDGKLLHGQYSSFYLNDNLKEKGVFKKGLKEGKWVEWYSNGKIKEIIFWKNGKKHGIYYHFDDKGLLTMEATYKNNLIEGYLISYENGKIIRKRNYKRGLEDIKTKGWRHERFAKKKGKDGSDELKDEQNKNSNNKGSKKHHFNWLKKNKTQ